MTIIHPAPFEVLFIHGAGESSLLWERVLNSLSGNRSGYSINLPGHPEGQITCNTIEDYAEFVHEFIIRNKLLKPVICGHSMGAAIAMSFALNFEEELSGLILIGAAARFKVMPEIIDDLAKNPMHVIEKVITPLSFYKLDRVIVEEARKSLSLKNPDVFINDYNACRYFDVRDKIRYIKSPTLIICGEQDRMTPPRWSHYLHANIADSILFIISGSGHMLPIEKPNECARLISSFQILFSH